MRPRGCSRSREQLRALAPNILAVRVRQAPVDRDGLRHGLLLLSSHVMALVEQLCDTVAVMLALGTGALGLATWIYLSELTRHRLRDTSHHRRKRPVAPGGCQGH